LVVNVSSVTRMQTNGKISLNFKKPPECSTRVLCRLTLTILRKRRPGGNSLITISLLTSSNVTNSIVSLDEKNILISTIYLAFMVDLDHIL